MPTIDNIRHANLMKLISECGSVHKLAVKMGKSDSQISQIKNRNKHSSSGEPREIGPDLAREFETKTGKPTGWMDTYWPFVTVTFERFDQLESPFRMLVEGAMLNVIVECERVLENDQTA